ncbi:MAG: serine/threonine-protein kinase [Nannocystales bacterium]
MVADTATHVPGLPERYRVEGPLGRGGQGQTFAAVDTHGGDAVVVKVFRLAGSDAWKRFELFERECAVLRSLKHPSIPAYVEHGGDEDAGSFFLVMQRAPGDTLQAQIDAGRRYTDGELEAILDGLLGALEYLHSLNPPVIHRDLKPGNVVLSEDGRVWLVDFGSVRDVLIDSRQSTVVGTYGYMAPEQLRGQSSPASDLYGLGATLAAAATGTDAAKLPAKGLDIELGDVIKPGPLRDRLQWMLRADPDARPGSVAALRAGPKARDPLAQRRDAGPPSALAKRPADPLATPVKTAPRPFGPRNLMFVLGSASTVAIATVVGTGSGVAAAVLGLSTSVLAVSFSRGLFRGLDGD